MIKKLKLKTQLMGAAMMTGILSSTASAQDFNDYTSTLSQNTNSTTDVVGYISYLGGFALCALGVVGLKQHVENPGQTPMKNGLAKLGFGGMLLAVPTLTTVLMESADSGSAGSAMLASPRSSF